MSDPYPATLQHVAERRDFYRTLGIHFALNKDLDIEMHYAPHRDKCVNDASEFLHNHGNSLWLILSANGDVNTLRRLDFMKWRVDHGAFGKNPRNRVIQWTSKNPRHDIEHE